MRLKGDNVCLVLCKNALSAPHVSYFFKKSSTKIYFFKVVTFANILNLNIMFLLNFLLDDAMGERIIGNDEIFKRKIH